MINLLAELFPKTFAVHEAKRRPLKIGIQNDLLEQIGGAVTEKELGIALNRYCKNAVYRSRLRAGATRYDLNGEPAGTVAAEDAAYAARTR